MILLGTARSAATDLNDNVSSKSNYNSTSVNIRDGVAYSNTYVPSPTEDKPKNKVAIAAIKTEGTIRIPESPVASKNNGFCSCVIALNDHFGTSFKTLTGFAKSIPVNSKIPASMGFVITYESEAGHIAHYYLDGSEIVIDWEANYDKCKVTSGRRLLVGSSLIKGYIND